MPGAADFWRAWREAEQLKDGGRFAAAHAAIDRADAIAAALGWNRLNAPLWIAESELLRGTLLHDAGELAAAYAMLDDAVLGWQLIGRALIGAERSPEFRAVVRQRVLERGAALGEAAFPTRRLIPAMAEAAGRAVSLAAVVDSYSRARRRVNELLSFTAGWQGGWDPVRFEIGLRMALGTALSAPEQAAAALGQADDALALARRLTDPDDRERTEAELRSNRAGALLRLGRPREALRDFEHAERWLRAAGRPADAAGVRMGVLRSRADAGEPVDPAALRDLLAEQETLMDAPSTRRGALVRDLEWLRRWYLAVLAERGSGELQEIVALYESLRGDRPVMRAAVDHEDPVVAELARPFTVLGSRLEALARTAILAVEPGMGANRESAHPPSLLTLWRGDERGLRWHLAKGHPALSDAITALTNAAAGEGDRLTTGELGLRQPASAELRDAATRAWELLPEPAREAVAGSDTVFWLPSARAGFDAFPVELLRHAGGWLGGTHAVARAPSFQQLEELLAPNRRHAAPPARATVVQVAGSDELGELSEATADVAVALRAAAVLGLEPELRHVAAKDDFRAAFAGAALVHYVGHGFAGELGEWLPLSPTAGVTPDEIAWSEDDATPVVFFNACLLGRVRQVPGARHRGWAVSLLAHGSPAVIGALIPVPDSACAGVATAFYRAAATAPLGEALRAARARLEDDGFHPLIGGAYVLHGDPNASLAGASSADLTRRWPAELTRALATGAPQQATGSLRDGDPEGAGALRIARAVERLEAGAPDARAELDAAYLCASALIDSYAEAFLLARYRDHWPADGLEATLRYKLAQLGDDAARVSAAARA